MASTPIQMLEDDVVAAIRAMTVPILWGGPGLGKTALVKSVAKRLGMPLYVIIGALCDPTDINGFPVVDASTVSDAAGKSHKVIRFAPRDFLIEIEQKHKGRALIFFDELTGTPPATLSAMLRTVIDRCFGDFQLDPFKVAMVAAANPPDQAVNGQELPPPMANRLLHLEFPTGETAVHEWAGSFSSYWGDEPAVEFDGDVVPADVMRRARAVVSGFVVKFPALWHKMPEDPMGGTVGFCTPRSWDAVSRHLGWAIHEGKPPITIARRVSGLVGHAASVEFETYLKEMEIPDPEEILKDPSKYAPSGRIDVDFVVLTSVVAAVVANPKSERILRGMEICNKVATARGQGARPSYEAGAVAVGKIGALVSPLGCDKMFRAEKLPLKAQAEFSREIYRLFEPYKNLRSKIYAPLEEKK